jgi:hypothetical protein
MLQSGAWCVVPGVSLLKVDCEWVFICSGRHPEKGFEDVRAKGSVMALVGFNRAEGIKGAL